MTTTVELATVPSADTPGSCIYVHHDKRSYILGRVADGTQRAFGSRKIHLGGTEHVFLSGPVGSDEIGGLLGYLLSVGGGIDSAKEHVVTENEERRAQGNKLLKQVQHNGVTVHGGDNLCHVLAACRAVILRQSVKVQPHEHRTDPRAADAQNMDPDWQDDAVRVWKIPVRTARSSSPPKRRHSSLDEPDAASYKPRSTLSDPDVAAMIVQNVMFSGSHKNNSVLPSRWLRQLKPTDVAIVDDQGKLSPYKGPYATDGQTLPDPDRKAWVFQGPGSSPGDGSPSDDGLPINHYPLSPTCYGQTSMSYVLKCHDRRGKFNAPIATELGVKREDFKRLAVGESVPGKDGTTVTPDMVLGERQPGHGIVVADIPSHDFVDAFMERPEWQSAELMAHIAMMYWILGPGLAGDPRVQSFIQKHPQVKHVFCADDTCPNMITHPGPAEVQVKLRRIDPQRFPLLDYDNAVKYPAPPPESPIELGRAGRKLMLMPRIVHQEQAIAPFPDLVGASNGIGGEVLALAEKARAQASDPDFLARVEEMERDIPNRDAEIIPLGTGSSVPSKYRNVSGTLIRVPGIGNYLLDCGEGTLGQIRRALGADETAEVLRGLRCIVISHVHADHHTGAVAIIKAWYEQALRDKSTATLAMSCIGRYRTMLQELSQVHDFGFHRLRFPSCPWTRGKDRDVTTAQDLAAMAAGGGGGGGGGGDDAWGLASITRVPVPHCWRSYGTQLELTSGLRIAYSGDCRPSTAFAKACRGAHLLVHECTFGDDRQDHARAKKHSTMGEALGVARDMQARRTLLTHFSQRYSKADSLTRTTGEGEQGVLLALDMMRVRLGEFQHAACYVPAVQALLEGLAD
ncbi:beta-lactamase superfamily protein [Hirsutella rhossiliensis]|uniref:ribonuclease Z n=1 Tax=Hirsutella rhossiliensis TaxID=111463 RepID=A0A9P8N1K2_9HYPO|nr:beta-lactamase superfamily domain-containing protein [Hirsutella rhossiliensis]KAH0965968.1 beta-lactamase superfamily domain-containing protein [Hirsutella rhossiliensis]